jgi:amino acid transporter
MSALELADSLEAASSDMEYNYHVSDWKLLYECALVMRKQQPDAPRPFKTPLVPLVPVLGILVCSFMISALDVTTLTVALIWMAVGLVIYFLYSRNHSKLRKLNSGK